MVSRRLIDLNRHLSYLPSFMTNASLAAQDGEAAPAGCGVAVVDDTTTAFLDLRGVLDAGKEVQKLQKKRVEVRAVSHPEAASGALVQDRLIRLRSQAMHARLRG